MEKAYIKSDLETAEDSEQIVQQIRSTVASEGEIKPVHASESGERVAVMDFSDEQNNDADISDAETSAPPTTVKAAGTTSSAEDLFTCTDCGRTFNRIGNLRRHERSLHSKSDVSTAKPRKERVKRKSKATSNTDGKQKEA